MTNGAALGGDVADEAVWWYRDGAATMGPVTLTELQRLANGPLGPATLVWSKTFGDHWRRLDTTLASSGPIGVPPSADYGRWTKSFARFDADPLKRQWSWLGLIGPLAYFYLGMWRRALIIVSVALAFQLLFALADFGHESHNHILPNLAIMLFCARNIKRDYYAFRVLGEPMWSRLRIMSNGYVCGAVALSLFLAIVALAVTDPLDNLITDVAGVWQSDGANVVIDVDGETKTITWGGTAHTVRMASVDGHNGVIVFKDVLHPERLITLHKHWSENHDTYSVDLLVDDQFVANLTYVRPV